MKSVMMKPVMLKKLALVTLVAGTWAQAVAKPYAQVDAGLYSVAVDGNKNIVKVESNASRFGFKEEYELTPTTSGIVQAEFGVNADGVNDTTVVDTDAGATKNTYSIGSLKSRNIFVGLKDTTFGTVKIGNHDSYVKLAQGEVDFFNDAAGEEADMKKVFKGENRLSNVIMYESPSYMGVQAKVMLQQGEEVVKDTAGAAPAGTEYRNKLADGQSMSVSYTNEDAGIYAAVAMDKNISAKSDNKADGLEDTMRLVGSYKAPIGLVVNGMYNTYKPSVNNTANVKQDGFLFGLGYNVTEQVFVKAQYQAATTSKDLYKDAETNQVGLGVDYAFSEKVKGTVMYTVLDKEAQVKATEAVTSAKTKIMGVSLKTKF